MHPIGAALLLFIGGPAAAVFAVMHDAGDGILTIANGTLPLVLFGTTRYGQRQRMLMVPAHCGTVGVGRLRIAGLRGAVRDAEAVRQLRSTR